MDTDSSRVMKGRRVGGDEESGGAIIGEEKIN